MMNDILTRLPYFDRPQSIPVEGLNIEVRRDQLVCWCSLSDPLELDVSPALLPKFPLLIDTGHNHNLSMQVSQLRNWAGLQTSKLVRLGDVLINGRRAALYELTLWIHPNQPGKSELDSHRQPCRVDLYDGVSILPDRGYPRIPLLGLRAISSAGIRLEVNGASQTMSMNFVSGAMS